LSNFLGTMYRQRYLYLMSVPFMVLVFIFNYIPIWGWTMSFQNFKLGRSFSQQEWVGLKHFTEILSDPQFYIVLRNTLAMSIMGLIAGFTIPVIFAVSLNEVSSTKYKKIVQTISYLPHFVSWVVVAGIFYKILSTDGGIINDILLSLGVLHEPIQFMSNEKLFWWIVTVADVWKEMGWNSIIFIAAITSIDPGLYDAAKVDGCGRFGQIWHITLPGIRSVIIVLLILSIGNLIRTGFEKQMLLGNALVFNYSEVLDLYALKYGLGLNRFSFGTAIGMFSSLVSVGLLFVANGLFRKFSNESVI